MWSHLGEEGPKGAGAQTPEGGVNPAGLPWLRGPRVGVERGTARGLTTEGHGLAANWHLYEVSKAGTVPRRRYSETDLSHTKGTWG